MQTTCVPSPWLTSSMAATYLHIRESKLTELLNAGTIQSYKRGRTRFVHTQDLDAWMRSLPSGASPMAEALCTTAKR